MKSVVVLSALAVVISAVFGELKVDDSDNFPDRRPFDIETKVKLYLIGSAGKRIEYELQHFEDIHNDANFDPSKPTVIHGHGFLESSEEVSVTTIVDAYLKRGGYNIILVDWFEFSTGSYHQEVLPRLYHIGHMISRYLVYFIQNGYSAKKIHLVGHSMGGQLVGLIGRDVVARSGVKNRIGKITALDPAGVGFEPMLPGSFSPTSYRDADFVDIIHTDGGYYGFKEAVGSVDFFPNGGSRYQPGCKREPYIPDETQSGPLGFCSHWKSWQYYALSVMIPSLYPAVKCDSWDSFVSGNCDRGDVEFMGFGTRTNATGTYYLRALLPSNKLA